MEAVQFTLDTIYKEKVGRNQLQINLYKKLYNLPQIQYLQHTCIDSYNYAKKKNYFVIVVLYNHEGKIFMQHDGTGWSLPGGSNYHNDDFIETTHRVVKNISPLINISETKPILLVDNTFCHKTNAHTMHGIVFTARLTQKSEQYIGNQGSFISLDENFIETIQKYGNKDILLYIHNKIIPTLQNQEGTEVFDEEISTNEDANIRYEIHRTFMKPLLKILGINKNEYIKKWLIDQCKNHEYIIDISCGDDSLVQELASSGNHTVVANDISWSQLVFTYTHQNNLLFTNHNATSLPYTGHTFDVAICKNTLHHMPTREHILTLLKNLQKIANKIIIVEIENPSESKGIAYYLHKYWYHGFLHDAGKAYINNMQITKLVQQVFGENYRIQQGRFTTKQGNYSRFIIE